MPDQMITRGVSAVMPMTSQAGKNYWIVTDDQGQEWRVWDAPTAMAANQLLNQMAQMIVRIAPSKNPEFGMNYVLKKIGPAAPGATSEPMPLMQQQQPQMSIGGTPMPIVMPTAAPAAMPIQNPAKTMGQGGNMTDADLTRIARSTAITAAVGAAFMPEDFRDEENELDWERVYAVAEAISKFILFRAHEGWEPGVEITPSTDEQQVLAEIHNVFPGAQQVPLDTGSDDASGGDVPWDS